MVNPDEYVAELGADAVRAYLMFIGPWEQGGEWDDSGISGMSRWLNRVWNLVLEEYEPERSCRMTEAEPRTAARDPPDHQEGHRGHGKDALQHHDRRADGVSPTTWRKVREAGRRVSRRLEISQSKHCC